MYKRWLQKEQRQSKADWLQRMSRSEDTSEMRKLMVANASCDGRCSVCMDRRKEVVEVNK